MQNIITIRREAGRYYACFTGPHDRTCMLVFGQTRFPTAYRAPMDAEFVRKQIAHNNPDCTVILGARLQVHG